ncbi:FAD/NAD(P)-binding domain-containing protein [Aspergillus japonicus CBS 114.51]|uniref:FAD/NAD(P)-binding domain-containing protein n=1 Tax=Aspergillus japonicus CBS 114.51 TaxID=1448312 RepID=A0A8T8WRY1_ASPJA|nr:FAD/NAD(P)-binding domain-containing protein [Aspergillus japonicus CBS 114.51]RAH78089.1 FAD/NAD(P)-binding domain-containing protein [Aspergillus japonicus CBS 114.51]
MPPRYSRVAVIGTGPSGLSAVKALHDENTFDTIRVFERRDRVGGIWHYDAAPDPFPSPNALLDVSNPAPSALPQFTPPLPENTTARTGIYYHLDSNVGAKAMSFTHTPFPEVNSALSIRQFGPGNASRPFRVVANYIEDLFQPYLHLVSLQTTVERVEKIGEEWRLTLRKSGQLYRGVPQDYWWTEAFDAVIVATGHYNVPNIPEIPGLAAAWEASPRALEHAKAFRSANHYVNQRVLVVGGNVSAADIVTEIHPLVAGPLYLSQRGSNPVLEPAWTLSNVQRKPTIAHVSTTEQGITAHFTDATSLTFDKIIFATGYRASYPFLTPDPVTPNNRVAGFYQHIFRIADPSLALVGQVRAAISFRVYEYQAVAVARYFAGRSRDLPSKAEQDHWEFRRLQSKGNGVAFHEIKPDFKEYFDFLVDLAGEGAGLPPWEDRWAEEAFEILQAKEAYWKKLKAGESQSVERAKL